MVEGLFSPEEYERGAIASGVALFVTAVAFTFSAVDRLPVEARTSTALLAQFEHIRKTLEAQERVTEESRSHVEAMAMLLHSGVDEANREGWPDSS